MNLPGKSDYIDIHTHDNSGQAAEVFSVISLMAHEEIEPVTIPGISYTCGIHPWHLTETNHKRQIARVIKAAGNPAVIAVGEAGFDKLKGPSPGLQRETFEEQVSIAEGQKKPVVVHCVKAWDELLRANKKLRPTFPWLVHGFRGKSDLALQLISKGMYLSFWFDFVMRPESSVLIKSLPLERIFLETDSSGIDIRDMYNKVSTDLEITVDGLKAIIYKNFIRFFSIKNY